MPVSELLGFWVERVEAGSATVVIEADDRHADVMGVTHGRLLFVLAAAAADCSYPLGRKLGPCFLVGCENILRLEGRDES